MTKWTLDHGLLKVVLAPLCNKRIVHPPDNVSDMDPANIICLRVCIKPSSVSQEGKMHLFSLFVDDLHHK